MSKLIVDGLIHPTSKSNSIKNPNINLTPSAPLKINPSLDIENYIDHATPRLALVIFQKSKIQLPKLLTH